MRPEILNPLFAPLTSLPGVGPKLAPLVERVAGGPHVADLLWLRPRDTIDRSFTPKIMEAPDGRVATLRVTIDRHFPSDSSRRPWRVRCSDETGFLHLVYFHARKDWLEKLLPEGEERIVSGKIEHFNNEVRMTHPDHVVPVDQLDEVLGIEPVYPLTAGLAPRVLAKAIQNALDRAPELPEWDDAAYLKRQGWPAWRAALTALHSPQNALDLLPETKFRQRLAYDEILSNQLALALVRARLRRQKGRTVKGDGRLAKKIIDALPFKLTGAQSRALAEIGGDMAAPLRMLRLLQGDVGSGKTVVALLAMAAAVEAGSQAALMAPTELLAHQHMATLERFAAPAGLRLARLTGRDKGKHRDAVLAALAAGEIDILVGTHAIFQEDVEFRDLALAVIDEQHRFGVHQRLELAAKGKAADMLVMTATPIPRTLMLTAYGDMDVSRLDEKPAGRKPVDTRIIPLARLMDVVAAIKRAVDGGAKVYWVCPLVEESEKSDLAAAEERHAALAEVFGDRAGLVHGRMKGPARDKVMERFARSRENGGDMAVLVATTVIEVGVDVPEATVMVIERAERFGLAQLHQLRGRIGRGERPSSCLLVYGEPLGETARERLQILRETEDGFRIAEEDLRLRGAGEILGTRQSGLPEFRIAELPAHVELVATARDDARMILNADPELESPRGQALRTLLYLWGQDAQVATLRSG
jgi:ATP-dependent DNA helicase RecG